MGMRRLAGGIAQWAFSGALGAVVASTLAVQAFAKAPLGQPDPGAIGLQASGTDLRDKVELFHNWLLMPIITGICLFVLALLLWIMIRYNKKANPTPAKWSHNTLIEVIWTIVPVGILMVIAVFSFGLLGEFHRMPKPDVTVKAVGNQWFWTYEYPDQQIAEYTSNILPEEEAKKRGVPFRLAATQPLVVPVNATVRVLTTGNDVIHAFGVPSFGIVIDSIPGRTNQTWFKAREIGTYYGQCRELCGIDHAFMPIEVRVVSQADFDAWTVQKGGKTKAMRDADAAAAAVVAAAAAEAAKAKADADKLVADAAAAAAPATGPAAPPPAGPATAAPAPKTTPTAPTAAAAAKK
jgi:cytochrome c oxidase subunit 2